MTDDRKIQDGVYVHLLTDLPSGGGTEVSYPGYAPVRLCDVPSDPPEMTDEEIDELIGWTIEPDPTQPA